jgi:TPR repeat protein
MLVILFLEAMAFQLPAQETATTTNGFEEIKAKAEAGDAKAQFRLGSLYETRFHATTNVFELLSPTNANLLGAITWYRKAADEGNAKAQCALGNFYSWGYFSSIGTSNSTDKIEAMKWYRKAAEQGDAEAETDLGDCYKNGVGVSKDMVEAVKWYRKAAEQGSVEAQFILGMCFLSGDGVDKDFMQAYKWDCLAAAHAKKSVPAPAGMKMTPEQIEESYAESARSDLANLGFMGMTPGQIEEAKQLMRKEAPEAEAKVEADLAADEHKQFETVKSKAESENPRPWDEYALAMAYDEGKVVPKDEVEAVKWYRKAAEQGYASAQESLGRHYQEGSGVMFQDINEAVKWYRRAAIQGDESGQCQLGLMYESGRGVPKNYVEAYKWYSLSAAQGNTIAQISRDNVVAPQMTPEQIAEAQRLSGEFKPRKESGSDNSISSDNPKYSGTGFFITDNGYLISNYHVVKDATKVRLLTSAGLIDAKVVQVDAANDLALLKANAEGGMKNAEAFKPLSIAASRTVNLGGTVATVGFPNIGLQGFAPKLAKGEIASLSGAGDDPRYFQISVPVQPGNSGGALVDERGNVIGIVSAKLNASAALAASGALPENVNYAVKSSFLLSFLESVPAVSAKLKAPVTADRKFEDVVKSAQDAAVLVLVY